MSYATLSTTANHVHEGVFLSCPKCEEWTQSLKRYRVFDYLLFLVLGAAYQTVQYTACPSCMRKSLAWRSLGNLLPANFLWPLVLLWHGACYLASYTQGHSRSVLWILRRAE